MTPRQRLLDVLSVSGVRALVALAAVFLILPTLIVIGTSFGSGYRVTFPPLAWTFDSYASIPGSMFEAFLTSVRLGVVTVALAMILTVPAALAIVRGWLPGRSLIEALLRSPLQVPHIVLGVAFYQYYVSLGASAGIEFRGQFTGLLVAHLVIVAPYMLVALVGSAAGIDQALEEAAAGLGAGFWRTTLLVTLPLMRPGLIAAAILGFLISFNEVTVSMFVAAARATTLPVELLGTAETELTPVLYAAASLTAVISVVTAILVERTVGLRSAIRL